MAFTRVPTCKHGCTDYCVLCVNEELAILRPIADAAKGLAHGTDWNNGTHAKIYRPKLIAALRALEGPNA